MVNLNKPGIGGKLLLGQSPNKNTSVYPKGLGGDKPAWVAFDKQVSWEFMPTAITQHRFDLHIM